MNDSTRVIRRPRRAWPPTTATVVTAAALTLLAAACGSSPASTGSGGSSSAPSAIAFSRCMRSHGVARYPDPDSGGGIPKVDPQRLGVSSSQLQTAESACQHLLPSGGGSLDQQTEQCMSTGDCPPALVQQVLGLERSFAQCMRSHGVPRWPDPTLDSQGRPVFVISISGDLGGVDPHSAQMTAEQDECGRLTGSPEPREVSP